MSTETFALTWSASQLGEAIEVLARSNGCDAGRAQIPYDSGNAFLPNHALEQWVQDTAQWYGLEAEQVEVTYDAVDEMLQQTGPALLKLPENSKENGKPQFLVLLGDGKPVSVLASNLSTRKVAPGWVRSRLVESLEEPLSREVEPLIILAGIPAKRRDRARAALIRERLRNKSVTSFWKLRTPPGASFADQVIGRRFLPGLWL